MSFPMLNVWRHNFQNPDPIRTKIVAELDIPDRGSCTKFESIVLQFAEVMIF